MLKLKFQYVLCVILVLAGVALLFMGFLVDPVGAIDNSVLVAYGEISTFAGSILGIDYNYKIKSIGKDDK